MRNYFSKVLLLSCLTTPAFAHIDCMIAKVDPQVGVAGHQVNVYSKHTVQITNHTGYVATYFYTFTLCADYKNCKVRPFQKILNPGQTFTKSANVILETQYNVPGTYGLTATTKITGQEDGEIKGNGSVRIDR